MARTVAKGLEELEGRLALTDPQEAEARDRGDSVVRFFTEKIDMAEPAFRAGSYQRRSIIRPERDVDVVAPVAFAYWGRYQADSRRFLYWIREQLNAHYGSTKVSSKGLAVHIAFSTITVDVVPCFRRKGGGYLMPDGVGGWQPTNPPYHVTMMETANKSHDWDLKPIVRLAKAWNTDNGHRLASFHVELMVEQAWRYRSITTTKARSVADTLSRLSSAVREAHADPWSPGVRIDRYLDTKTRSEAASLLVGDAAAAEAAERLRLGGREQAAYEKWAGIYPKLWPSWG